jgi:hypothetical protein
MTPLHKMRMKIPIQKSISPFSKGGEGDSCFLLLRHCEERSDVAISPTRPVIASSAATWQSHFLKFL